MLYLRSIVAFYRGYCSFCGIKKGFAGRLPLSISKTELYLAKKKVFLKFKVRFQRMSIIINLRRISLMLAGVSLFATSPLVTSHHFTSLSGGVFHHSQNLHLIIERLTGEKHGDTGNENKWILPFCLKENDQKKLRWNLNCIFYRLGTKESEEKVWKVPDS